MGKHKTRNIIFFTIGVTILISALGWVTYNIMDYFMSSAVDKFPIPKIISLGIIFFIIIILLTILGIKGKKLLNTVLGKM